jgi:hypothetical protein
MIAYMEQLSTNSTGSNSTAAHHLRSSHPTDTTPPRDTLQRPESDRHQPLAPKKSHVPTKRYQQQCTIKEIDHTNNSRTMTYATGLLVATTPPRSRYELLLRLLSSLRRSPAIVMGRACHRAIVLRSVLHCSSVPFPSLLRLQKSSFVRHELYQQAEMYCTDLPSLTLVKKLPLSRSADGHVSHSPIAPKVTHLANVRGIKQINRIRGRLLTPLFSPSTAFAFLMMRAVSFYDRRPGAPALRSCRRSATMEE